MPQPTASARRSPPPAAHTTPEQPQIAEEAPAPLDPPPEPVDVELVAAALACPEDSVADLRTIERGRAAAQRIIDLLDSRVDRMKSSVAEVRESIVILKPRQYSAAGVGAFATMRGAEYRKTAYPLQYRAIVSQGRVGQDFAFKTVG